MKHYLLPAAVVDGYGFRESVESMKRLEKEVPATLVGMFGIDVAGRVVGTIMAPVYFILFLAAIGVGLLVGQAIPAFYVGDVATWFADNGTALPVSGPLHLNVLPLVIAIWVAKFGGVILDRVTTSVKVLYFTVFYMRIAHPDKLSDEMREPLEHYLKMEDENGEAEVEHTGGPGADR